MIFKRKALSKETFPLAFVIRCNEKGWIDENLMIDYFTEVWRKRNVFFSAQWSDNYGFHGDAFYTAGKSGKEK